LDRREFLRRTAQLGGAVALGGPALAANARVALAADDFGSMLDDPAKESPIDTVVVVMMENRSFDHYFGWVSEADALQDQSFPDPEGNAVPTRHFSTLGSGGMEYKGCGHPDPGHGWIPAARSSRAASSRPARETTSSR
jgi:phospholipase C